MSAEDAPRQPTLRPQELGIPAPVPSARSLPYWEGCRVGELRFQRCDRCGAIPPKPAPICNRCQGRSLTWERSEGRGSLYSWTVVWRPQRPVFRVPYAPAVIALDEGYHLMSSIIGCEPDELRADMPVTVEFHPASAEIALPYFRPAG